MTSCPPCRNSYSSNVLLIQTHRGRDAEVRWKTQIVTMTYVHTGIVVKGKRTETDAISVCVTATNLWS